MSLLWEILFTTKFIFKHDIKNYYLFLIIKKYVVDSSTYICYVRQIYLYAT